MLNGPQRKFCEGIVAGLSAMKAYAAAYPNAQPNSVESNATRLMGNDGVRAEIEKLRKRADEMKGGAVLTLRQKREFLARVVAMKGDEIDLDKDGDLVNGIRLKEQGRELLLPDKLKAIQIDNDLSGDGAEAEGNKALGGLAALVARLRK